MKIQRPTRICLNALMLKDDRLSGIGNYTLRMAGLLAARNPDWEVSVMVRPRAASPFRNIPGLHCVEAKVSTHWQALFFSHVLFPLQSGKYDLVHSIGNIGLLFCRAPQVITLHDTYESVSKERYRGWKSMILSFLVSATGQKARWIMTDSQNSKKDIEHFYPHLAPKVSVVYLGTKFPVNGRVSPDNRKDFLSVGTLEPGKNLPLVVRAFADFHRMHGGCLRLAGAQSWRDPELSGLIDSLGVADAVDFLGYVSDGRLQELYEGSLALIQASTYEGFGLPVIEAMACGCPVIAARNSGLVEAGGEAALYFQDRDAGDLTRRMESMWTDRTLRETCIRSGYLHAANFTWEKTCAETEKVYRHALGMISRK